MCPSSAKQPNPASSRGIKLVELETFIAVAETGSFSLAAERMHVTQPSVTSRVQRLEALLQCKLLERNTRKVDLTDHGATLAREASVALKGLWDLVESFRVEAKQLKQRVVIAATPTVAALRMPPLISQYLEKHPDIEIELRDLQYPDALAALDDGSADVAVMALNEDDLRYGFTELWSEEMVLVVPNNHPIAELKVVGPNELATYPMMIIEQYSPMRSRMANALEQAGLQMPLSKVVGNLSTLLGMLDAKMGITLLPRVIASRASQGNLIPIRIEGLSLHRSFGLINAPGATASQACDNFCRFIATAVSAEQQD